MQITIYDGDVALTRQRCDLVGCIGAQTNLRADRFEHRHTWVAVAYRQMELTAATEDVARFSDYCDLSKSTVKPVETALVAALMNADMAPCMAPGGR